MRAAIILAAGASRRFGHQDKLKTRLFGRRLLDHAIDSARASGVHRIILVVDRPVFLPGLRIARARNARSGMSASLTAGLKALRPIDREALIFLGDMPFGKAPAMMLRAGYDAIRPRYRTIPGHPMLVRSAAARKVLAAGDAGLAGKLKTGFVLGDRGNVMDVDTQAMMRRARYYGSRRVGRRCN